MKPIKQLVNSTKHALRGVRHVFLNENSFKIQVLVGSVVVVLAFTFPLLAWEQIVILMLVGFVLIMELINSVLERLVDSFRSRVHPVVRDIKDIMAAAVLLASLFAAVIGLIIFIPYLIHLI
jgi:undecaprenol kinase